jgi:hypothetical protein
MIALSSARATVRERVEEALREIGILLIALSPLDAIVDFSHSSLVPLLLMWGIGLILFVWAISLENRRNDG